MIAIIEISLKTNKTTKPNIRIICLRVFVVYYLSSDEGCILKMKWCPKYSESEQEIGLLGVVTALGIFKIYSVPMKNNEELKNNSKIKNIEAQVFAKPPVLTVNFSTLLNKEQSLINCFDWVYSKENDIIAAGDQVLNNIIKYRAEDYLL